MNESGSYVNKWVKRFEKQFGLTWITVNELSENFKMGVTKQSNAVTSNGVTKNRVTGKNSTG